ncbi:dipeptidase [Corynebacterium guangdongense]|uniref:Acetylornithine deacetylase/succinyl-diaminopimelate desuccinylase-like protein n=1 Tax=Corynebacterium guangdongense TaxID=1783348 RepID=A0ABU1ZZR6_9CORY|nr:dipeptidase [Corynebacterium guangdongense]MDR7330325.1 acetylornithine deacetylase/succinyl-diaminopimelate desuccinylase-like protein [Corynebacterium guangdongense]
MTSQITVTDRERIFTDLKELVSFNSVHGRAELADASHAAAEWVAAALRGHGLSTEVFDTVDGSRTVLGRRAGAADAPTALLYSHYDVVPAGPLGQWLSDPFTLTERDGRWYGRGAADCKGNVAMHLAALRALEAHGGTDVNLTVLIEGSEENGGVGLDNLIETRPDLFQADMILIADSGNAAVGVPTLTASLRGGAQITVTVDTLKNPVHSGLFGGAAPDAVAALMRTLNSLYDDNGLTAIDGVDATGVWAGLPYDPETFRQDAAVLDGVDIYSQTPADQVWARPSVTVTGFSSTPVEEAVNAVPATASARLNLRVPDGMDPHETAAKVVAHVERHTPWNARVTVTVDDVNPTFSTDVTAPGARLLGECLKDAYGAGELALVGSGGSIPLTATLKKAVPQAEIVIFGVEEPQCTIHSPNESVDPGEIEHVAAAEAMFLQRFGK